MAKKTSRKTPRRARSTPLKRISRNEVNILKLFVKTTLGKEAADHPATTIGALTADFREGTLTRNGEMVASSAKERELLRYFLQRRGEVVTRDEIFRDVWRYDNPPASRSIDNYILALRKIIEVDPASPQHLLTLRGAGYRLV